MRHLLLLLVGFVLLAILGGCASTQTTAYRHPHISGAVIAAPEAAQRVFCADRALMPRELCLDAILDTSAWPDTAIVCIDTVTTCAQLGALRSWIERFSHRLLAHYDPNRVKSP